MVHVPQWAYFFSYPSQKGKLYQPPLRFHEMTLPQKLWRKWHFPSLGLYKSDLSPCPLGLDGINCILSILKFYIFEIA